MALSPPCRVARNESPQRSTASARLFTMGSWEARDHRMAQAQAQAKALLRYYYSLVMYIAYATAYT